MVSKMRGVRRVNNQVVSRSEVRNMIRNSILANQEIKRFSDRTTNSFIAAGSIVDVTQACVVGTADQSRSGDVILPRKVDINVSILNTSTNLVGTLCRVILFRDTLNSGVAPVVSQLLDGSSYNSTYTVIQAQQNRFKILMDKTWEVALGVHMAHLFKNTFRLRGPIYYNGDTNVVTANGAGSLWLLTISSAATALNFPSYDIHTSVHFTDS